jgi:hypothetical protein
MAKRTVICPSVALLCLAFVGAIRAQAPMTVWSGVYTAEQAARGKAAYDENCSVCHGPYLEGFRSTGSAKALAREPFMDRWDGGTLDELYQFIRVNMPKAAAVTGAAKVSDETKLEIVTYILQVNGFPAGSTRLEPSLLPSIQIRSKEGIRPLKNGMTVEAVGCVTQEGNKWLLTKATDPMRTRTDKLSTGQELATNAKRSGSTTVELVDAYPEPTQYKGQKVEVKGLFVAARTPGINLIDLQKVADTCN